MKAEIADMREQLQSMAEFMSAESKRLRKEARPLSYDDAEPGRPSRKYELEIQARAFEIAGSGAEALHMNIGFLIGERPAL